MMIIQVAHIVGIKVYLFVAVENSIVLKKMLLTKLLSVSGVGIRADYQLMMDTG